MNATDGGRPWNRGRELSGSKETPWQHDADKLSPRNRTRELEVGVDEPRVTDAGWSRPRSMTRSANPFVFRVKPGFVRSTRFEF